MDTIFSKLVKSPGGVANCPMFTGQNFKGSTHFCSVRSLPGGIL